MRHLLLFAGLLVFTVPPAHAQDKPSIPASTSPVSPATEPIGAPIDVGPIVIQAGIASPPARALQWWTDVDYLMWFVKPVCLVPVTLTTGSPADPVPGALGQPHTTPVMGDHKFEFGPLSGFRPTFGVWLDADKTIGLEASGFLLEQGSAKIAFDSTNGNPATYVPYQTPQNVPQALPFSTPGLVNGSAVAVGNCWLWGTELNLVTGFSATRGSYTLRADMLFGMRYLDLRDKVSLFNAQSLVGDPASSAYGAAEFTTHNQFFGGQVGMRFGVDRGRWSLLYETKVALGETHQTREITGSPLLAAQGNAAGLMPGPVLALPSNTGRESADRITVVPEVNLKLRYKCTDWMNVSLGYSCLYWNKVLCPGDQMDDHLNVTELPGRGPKVGPSAPAPLFVHTDFFAQGYSVGVEVRY